MQKKWWKNVNTVAKEVWAKQQKLWKLVATKRRHTQSTCTFSSMHMKNAHKTSFFSIKWSWKKTNSCAWWANNSTKCEMHKWMQFKWFNATSVVCPALQALQTLVPHAEETSCLCQTCYTRRKQSTSVVADDEQPTQKKKDGQQCHVIGCEEPMNEGERERESVCMRERGEREGTKIDR